MPQAPVLTVPLLERMGLARQLLTLTKTVEVRAHPELLDDFAFLHCEGLDEAVCCDRDYLRRHNIRFTSAYSAGQQVLAWTRPDRRRRSDDPANPEIEIILVIDLFLLDSPNDFKRFHAFVEGMQLRDAQGRAFLAAKAEELPLLVLETEHLPTIVRHLAGIIDGSEVTLPGAERPGYRALGSTYASALSAVRKSPLLPPVILALPPHERHTLFRLLCHAEDQEDGPAGLIHFVSSLSAASGVPALAEAGANITDAASLRTILSDLGRLLASPMRLTGQR